MTNDFSKLISFANNDDLLEHFISMLNTETLLMVWQDSKSAFKQCI